jgi:hypothetical protein
VLFKQSIVSETKMKNKIIIRNSKYSSPIKNILTEFRTKQKVEEDYFKERNMCYLGVINDYTNQYQWNKQYYANPFDDPNYTYPAHETLFLEINPRDFVNYRILARSGRGKTQIIKGIVCDYHKSGKYNVLVICPKAPEYVVAKNKGTTSRLHPKSFNERLRVSNYCAGHIKDYAEIKQFDLSGMKFYSHNIETFSERESWIALGLSPISGAFCSNLVKKGKKNLKQIYQALGSASDDELMYSTKSSAKSKISIAIEEGLFTKHKGIDFSKEFGEQGNIVVVNYYQKSGYLTSTDIALVVQQARAYTMNTKKTNKFKKLLVIFDDARQYCSDEDYNQATISLVENCQTMYRSDGVDNIVVLQGKKGINKNIAEGSDGTLLSFVTETGSLSDIIPKDAIDILNLPEQYGGLITDKNTFTKEWLWIPPESNEVYRFIPQGCKVGHDFM